MRTAKDEFEHGYDWFIHEPVHFTVACVERRWKNPQVVVRMIHPTTGNEHSQTLFPGEEATVEFSFAYEIYGVPPGPRSGEDVRMIGRVQFADDGESAEVFRSRERYGRNPTWDLVDTVQPGEKKNFTVEGE